MRKILTFLISILFFSQTVQSNIITIPDNFSSIQEGIISAESGDTILINPGNYFENLFIGNKHISLASTFILNSDTTVINSTVILPLDSRERILTIDSTTSGPIVISGLVFKNGFLGESEKGAAISVDSVVSLTINSCRFINNHAWIGGAIYIQRSNTNIQSCVFDSNYAEGGSGIKQRYGQINIYNSVFYHNTSNYQGGGLDLYKTVARVENSQFINNNSLFFGGSIVASLVGDSGIRNNVFLNNSSGVGGAFDVLGITSEETSITISQNDFINNTASRDISINSDGLGGAFYLGKFDSQIIEENRFISNTAFNAGAVCIVNNVQFLNNYCRDNSSVDGSVFEIMHETTSSIGIITGNTFIENHIIPYEGSTSRRGAIFPLLHTTTFISGNDFYSNIGKAITRYSWFPQDSCIVNLGDNYYGDPTGPFHEEDNPEGMGDTILANIPMESFSSTPFTEYRLANIRHLKRSHNFGVVTPGNGTSWTLPIRNGGSAALVFSRLETTNPAFVLGEYPDSIGTGETFNLNLLFAPQELGSYREELIIESNNCWDSLLVIPIKGQCRETNDIREKEGVPQSFHLGKPYPNPFNPMTRFEYDLPVNAEIEITVSNILGQEVACLYDGYRQAGSYSFTFDGSTHSAGLYFLTLTTPLYTHTEKMMLLK